MEKLSLMQVKFLHFSVDHTIFGFNGHMSKSLPCTGAVARNIAEGLIKRGYINRQGGMITSAGREALVRHHSEPVLAE